MNLDKNLDLTIFHLLLKRKHINFDPMHYDKRLFNIVNQTRAWLILTVASGLLAAFCIIAQAAAISRVINRVFLEKEILGSVWLLLLFFGVVSLLRAFFAWSEQSSADKIAAFVKTDLRRRINRHLLKSGPVYIRLERSGEISNTLMNGVEALDAYFREFLPQLFLSALIPLAILIFVFPIDLLTGVVFLLTAPLIPFFMKLIGAIAERPFFGCIAGIDHSENFWAQHRADQNDFPHQQRVSHFHHEGVESCLSFRVGAGDCCHHQHCHCGGGGRPAPALRANGF
jgi:ABC-type multidrug transport system fused ATPase/permease subunit